MFCDKLGTEIFTWTHSFATNSDMILVQGFCFLLAQWVPVFRTRSPAGYFWPNSDHSKMTTFHFLDSWLAFRPFIHPAAWNPKFLLSSCLSGRDHTGRASLSLDWRRSTAAFFEPVCEKDMLMRMIFKSLTIVFLHTASVFQILNSPCVWKGRASAKKLLSECFRQECHDIVRIIVRLWESLLACSPLVRLSSCGTLLPTGFWCSVSFVFWFPPMFGVLLIFVVFVVFLHCFWVLNLSLSRFWAAKTFLPPLLLRSISVRCGPRATFFCDGLGLTVQWPHDWAASVWRFESFGLFGSVTTGYLYQMNKIVWQVATSFWALSFLPNHSMWVYQLSSYQQVVPRKRVGNAMVPRLSCRL